MDNLIDMDEIIKFIELIKSDLVKIDTTDAIEVYSILDSLIHTFEDVKQDVSMKIWRAYVVSNPNIDDDKYINKYIAKVEGDVDYN